MNLRVLALIAAVLFPVSLAIAGESSAVDNNTTVSPIGLNDQQMDRVVAGLITIDLATEVSHLPNSDTHPFLPTGLTSYLGVPLDDFRTLSLFSHN